MSRYLTQDTVLFPRLEMEHDSRISSPQTDHTVQWEVVFCMMGSESSTNSVEAKASVSLFLLNLKAVTSFNDSLEGVNTWEEKGRSKSFMSRRPEMIKGVIKSIFSLSHYFPGLYKCKIILIYSEKELASHSAYRIWFHGRSTQLSPRLVYTRSELIVTDKKCGHFESKQQIIRM